jgi:hypothetical protein
MKDLTEEYAYLVGKIMGDARLLEIVLIERTALSLFHKIYTWSG